MRINEDDHFGEGVNTRLVLVQNILFGAVKRSQDLGKLMVDPLDVLACLVEDPLVQDKLRDAGIDLERLNEEIMESDRKTPQGEQAKAIAEMIGLKPNLYRSMVLDQSIAQAKKIADSEGCFEVTNLHLLAGLLRQGFNTAGEVFQKLKIPKEKFNLLTRNE